jgi:hypothetical protein
MKMRAFALAAVLHASQAVEDESVGAVAKIVQMLNDMSAKAKQEKKDEEVEFAILLSFARVESLPCRSRSTKLPRPLRH